MFYIQTNEGAGREIMRDDVREERETKQKVRSLSDERVAEAAKEGGGL